MSYFGPEANDFGLLAQFFIQYGQSGKGDLARSAYLRPAVPWNQVPGTFTPLNLFLHPTH
ncbi:hypothetical protein ACNKHU_20685 [Shigella flexneri]